MDFLFRGRDVAITMNSVKILHAVRSAITAIAELLVDMTLYCQDSGHDVWPPTRRSLRERRLQAAR